MLYLISGKAQTGKDTTAKIIADLAKEKGLKHINLQVSTTLKEYAKNISDWDGSEETKPRKLLQHLGTEIIRKEIDNFLFIRRLAEDIQVYQKFFDIITVSDIRFVLEIDYLKKQYENLITIRLERDTNQKRKSKHPTEIELDNYQDFDYIIKNNDTVHDLRNKLIAIFEKETKL